jgi:hypothetical protein
MGRLSEVFGSSTEQLEYKLQIDILEHTARSVSTVCTSPEAITYRQGAPFQQLHMQQASTTLSAAAAIAYAMGQCEVIGSSHHTCAMGQHKSTGICCNCICNGPT